MLPDLTEHEKSGIIFYTDDTLFQKTGVRIAFTGRHGGFSIAPLDTLDLADHVDDDPSVVSENRKKVLEVLGAPDEILLGNPSQVHGTDIWHIEIDDQHLLPYNSDLSQSVDAKIEADAVIVSEPGIAALLCYADCVPVILVREDGSFSVVHAGWRGAVGGIVEKAVAELDRLPVSNTKAVDGSSKKRIYAYIGPCIRKECFEVSQDVENRFIMAYGSTVAQDRHIDLPYVINEALMRSGVLSEDIADCGICTSCNDTAFYSYRASGGVTGRHGAIAFRTPR